MSVKSAIVIFNMGGVRSLDDVEMFLSNMFNDKYIIRTKIPFLRRFIANKITTTRKEVSKKLYRKLGGFSPSVKLFNDLAKCVKKRTGIDTFLCFRYVPPFSAEVVNRLKSGGYNKLYLIPSYPQYSSTTTLSSFKDFEQTMELLEYSGVTLYKLRNYFDNNDYIDGIVNSIKDRVSDVDVSNYILICSSHSIPLSISNLYNEPYYSEILMTIELVKKRLEANGIFFKDIKPAFQSKVGKAKWIEPTLSSVMKECRGENVLLYPISFLVDNLESDYELAIEYFEKKYKYGIKDFRVCKALNSSNHLLDMVDDFITSLDK